jgi:type IV fimbrial biogenesis protein FimT
MKPGTRQQGFTVAETLTALAVVGIGVSMAVVGLDSLADHNHRSTAVNRWVSTLHLARSEAVTRNAQVAVCASRSGERCDGSVWEEGWIAFVDPNGDEVRSDSELILDQVDALPGLNLRSPQFATTFTYRSNGRLAGTGSGEFAFCEAGAEKLDSVVVVRTSGIPALTDRRLDGSTTGCLPA